MADKRREGVRIRQGDTDFVVAPDPELEVIREVAKGRAYLQPGEKPPKGVAAHEGPRGGRYYEEGSRARTSPQTGQDSPHRAAESAREGVPEHRKPRLRDIQRTFAGVLRARGVTKDELGSVARAWFMKWDSDAGLLMVDILMGREAARAYLRTHQERLPPERADQYLNNLRTEDTWYSRDLRPGVLSAVRVASQTALREAGIDALPVYRGVSGEMARGLQEGQSYRPRPMESWTTKQSFAEKWAAMSPGEAGAVVKKTIPTDQVFLFSDAVPSLRRFGQHEVVVMRGKGETLRLSKGVMLAKKHGQEYSELDDLDQDIHPKNVGVRVGIPSYVAQAKKGRIYIGEGEKPPEGVRVEEGPRGGHYYEAHGTAAPESDPAQFFEDFMEATAARLAEDSKKHLARNAEWYDSLTPVEVKAISSYLSMFDFAYINAYLRTGESDEKQMPAAEIKGVIQTLDKMLAKAPDSPPLLWRGVVDNEKWFRGMRVGEEFSDTAFISTSASKDAACGFAGESGDLSDGVLVKIVVPPGTKAAYVDAVRSKGEFEDDLEWMQRTNEYLLPRHQSFKVLSWGEEEDWGLPVMEVALT